MPPTQLETARQLLCQLENHIQAQILQAQRTAQTVDFAAIAAVTAADTIYQIDKLTEEAILAWFQAHWPTDWAVELVMEGVEEDDPLTFPQGTAVDETQWKCIIDPVDGTRNIMYDKRSAWTLAALAPQKGPNTCLSDILVAAMTELPTSKQWRADQISVVKGARVVAYSVDTRSVERTETSLSLMPSRANTFKHGFAAISRFFPEGKSLLAKIEEELWDELYGLGSTTSPMVFEDQYVSTGGQLYELLTGHDRMLADLRPLVLSKLGFDASLVCHPYDICTALILTEAGLLIEAPDGSPLDAPLDTTSPVAWIGFANQRLAAQARPILQGLIEKYLA